MPSPSTKRSFTEQAGNPPVLNLVDSDLIRYVECCQEIELYGARHCFTSDTSVPASLALHSS
jgi:hypothetical protein